MTLQVGKGGSPSKGGSGKRINAAEVSDFLSEMFEGLLTEEQMGVAMQPSAIIQAGLLPHQQEALAWMVQRENNSALPPFWEPHKVWSAVGAMLKPCLCPPGGACPCTLPQDSETA